MTALVEVPAAFGVSAGSGSQCSAFIPAPAFLDDSNTSTVVYVAGGTLPELAPDPAPDADEPLPTPDVDPLPGALPLPAAPLPGLAPVPPPPLPPPLLLPVPELLPDPAPEEPVPLDPEPPVPPGGVVEPHA